MSLTTNLFLREISSKPIQSGQVWLVQTADRITIRTIDDFATGEGQELDFTASYNISARTNLLLGYSHFFTGDYYTANGSFDGDADFYYSQVQVNF